MQDRYNNGLLEFYSGQLYPSQEAEVNEEPYEIYQWYILQDKFFAVHYTNELVFYDNELDVFVLGVTFVGADWSICPPPELTEGLYRMA